MLLIPSHFFSFRGDWIPWSFRTLFYHFIFFPIFSVFFFPNLIYDTWALTAPTIMTGLYFKLHGTHRPNSMKKTVIKRRKRVPAAGGVTAGRMTDQAAAEALVAVGRLGVGMALVGGGEESDGEVEQPKKKRAKKGKNSGERERGKKDLNLRKGVGRDEDDVDMEASDDDGGSIRERERERIPQQQRRRSRESNGSTTWDLAGMTQSGENGHVHGHSGHRTTNGSSPPLDRRQRASSVSRLQPSSNSGEYQQQQRSSSGGGVFMGSPHPHPHGGFDLPPLNAAVGGAGYGGGAGFMGMGMGGIGAGGAPSSYIRSGSSAPSRTHSPLGPGGIGSGYVLPPPHSLSSSHGGGHGYYAQPTGMSPHHTHSPPPTSQHHSQTHDSSTNGSVGIPTIGELKRHYEELHEQRKKLDEMAEKTEKMMAGVKRGLDEMRGVHLPSGGGSGSTSSTASASQSGGAVPLMRSGGEGDRPRSRASVWPLDSTGSSSRD
jgi:GATA-binding protein